MNKEVFLSERGVRDQLMMDEMSILKSRCDALEDALKDYLKEAHFKCLDGIIECDHAGGVCYCAYHKALGKAQRLIGTV